jgi:hypothetical protein
VTPLGQLPYLQISANCRKGKLLDEGKIRDRPPVRFPIKRFPLPGKYFKRPLTGLPPDFSKHETR